MESKLYCANPEALKSKLDEICLIPRVILYGNGKEGTFLYYHSDEKNSSTNIDKFPQVVFAFGDNVEANEFFRRSYKKQAGEKWEYYYDQDKNRLELQAAQTPIHQGGSGQAAAMLARHAFYIDKKADPLNHENWHYVKEGELISDPNVDVSLQSTYPPNVIGIPICMDTGAYGKRSEHIIAALDAAFDELEKHLENGRTIVIPALDNNNSSIGAGLAGGRMGNDATGVKQHLQKRVKQLQDYAVKLETNPEAKKWKDKSFHEMESDYQARIKVLEQSEIKKDTVPDDISLPQSPKVPTSPYPVHPSQTQSTTLNKFEVILQMLEPGQMITPELIQSLQALRRGFFSPSAEEPLRMERQFESPPSSSSELESVQNARSQMKGLKIPKSERETLSFLIDFDETTHKVEIDEDTTARAGARMPGKQDRHVSPISFVEHSLTDFMEPEMNEMDVLKMVLYQLDVLSFPHEQAVPTSAEEAEKIKQDLSIKKGLLDYVKEIDAIEERIKKLDKALTGNATAINNRVTGKTKPTTKPTLEELKKTKDSLLKQRSALAQKREELTQERQAEVLHTLSTYYVNLPNMPTRSEVGELGQLYFKLFNERTEMIMRSNTKKDKNVNPTPDTTSLNKKGEKVGETATVTNTLKALAEAEWKLANALTSPEEAEKSKATSARLMHHNISADDKKALRGCAFLPKDEVDSLVQNIFDTFDYRPYPKGSNSTTYPKPDEKLVARSRYYNEPVERLYRLAADHLALVFVLCPNLQEQHQLSIMTGFVEQIAASYEAQGYAGHPNWKHLVDETDSSKISREKLFSAIKITLDSRYRNAFDNYRTEDQILNDDYAETIDQFRRAEFRLSSYAEQVRQAEEMPLAEPKPNARMQDDKKEYVDKIEIDIDPFEVPSAHLDHGSKDETHMKVENDEIDEGYGSDDEVMHEELEGEKKPTIRPKSSRPAAIKGKRFLAENREDSFSGADSSSYVSSDESDYDSDEEKDTVGVYTLQSGEVSLPILKQDLVILQKQYIALQAMKKQIESDFSAFSPLNRDQKAANLNQFYLATEAFKTNLKSFERKYGEVTNINFLSEHEDAKTASRPRDRDDDEKPQRELRQDSRVAEQREPRSADSKGEEKKDLKRERDEQGDALTQMEDEQPDAKKKKVELRPPVSYHLGPNPPVSYHSELKPPVSFRSGLNPPAPSYSGLNPPAPSYSGLNPPAPYHSVSHPTVQLRSISSPSIPSFPVSHPSVPYHSVSHPRTPYHPGSNLSSPLYSVSHPPIPYHSGLHPPIPSFSADPFRSGPVKKAQSLEGAHPVPTLNSDSTPTPFPTSFTPGLGGKKF